VADREGHGATVSVEVDGHPVVYDKVPGTSPFMRTAGENWVEHGHLDPNDFLYAVATNDLKLAVLTADDANIKLLPEWVNWFRWHAPSQCHGSKEKVKAWAKERGR